MLLKSNVSLCSNKPSTNTCEPEKLAIQQDMYGTNPSPPGSPQAQVHSPSGNTAPGGHHWGGTRDGTLPLKIAQIDTSLTKNELHHRQKPYTRNCSMVAGATSQMPRHRSHKRQTPPESNEVTQRDNGALPSAGKGCLILSCKFQLYQHFYYKAITKTEKRKDTNFIGLSNPQ